MTPKPTVARFRELTTMRVGGPIAQFRRAETTEEFAHLVTEAWGTDQEWYILGAGSNTVATEEPFNGIVIQDGTQTFQILQDPDALHDSTVLAEISAGFDWDELVVRTISEGLQGLETMSGIPGTVGAAPIQNIGAYGTELSETLHSIEFLDAQTWERTWIPAKDLELGYRTSAMKRGRRGAVLRVRLELKRSTQSGPITYQQLANHLGVALGDRVDVMAIRQAVLQLRGSKGMVLDPNDPDSRSAGSFFMNPIVPRSVAETLPAAAPRWSVTDQDEALVERAQQTFIAELPAHGAQSQDMTELSNVLDSTRKQVWQEAERIEQVKLSAAWLIEQSGIQKGFRLPGSQAHVSTKHTLALVNAGNARGEEVSELARYIQSRVAAEFGVVLIPEPNLLGLSL